MLHLEWYPLNETFPSSVDYSLFLILKYIYIIDLCTTVNGGKKNPLQGFTFMKRARVVIVKERNIGNFIKFRSCPNSIRIPLEAMRTRDGREKT